MKINQEQINEWAENPITEALLSLAEDELDRVMGTPVSDCYVPGEPFKTQDNLSNIEARQVMWRLLCDLLEGDWSYMDDHSEEDEVGE